MSAIAITPHPEPLEAEPPQGAALPELAITPTANLAIYGSDLWPGFMRSSSTPGHAPKETFQVVERWGKPTFKWTCWTAANHGYGPNTATTLRTMVMAPYSEIQKGMKDPKNMEKEGDEAFYGTALELPAGQTLPYMWALPSFEAQSWHVTHPNYGHAVFRSLEADHLGMIFACGKLPPPGSTNFNPYPPPDGYKAAEIFLGAKGAAPLVKGKRIDFLLHIIWRARSNGVWRIDYRVDGQAPYPKWTRLYSNVAGDSALIQRPPHPTMVWNEVNGSPGEGGRSEGLHLAMQGYGSADPPSWGADYSIHTLGLWRRQTREACLAEFPDVADVPPEPILPPVPVELEARVATLERENDDLQRRLAIIEKDMGTDLQRRLTIIEKDLGTLG